MYSSEIATTDLNFSIIIIHPTTATLSDFNETQFVYRSVANRRYTAVYAMPSRLRLFTRALPTDVTQQCTQCHPDSVCLHERCQQTLHSSVRNAIETPFVYMSVANRRHTAAYAMPSLHKLR